MLLYYNFVADVFCVEFKALLESKRENDEVDSMFIKWHIFEQHYAIIVALCKPKILDFILQLLATVNIVNEDLVSFSDDSNKSRHFLL